MVISLAILITVIPTIIVVTMASIFWCCWSKKGSADFNEKKSKATKEEPTHDKSLAAGKLENGVVAEIQSTPQSEMRLPLLSSDAMEDSIEDLSDFAAVQRETEILRPYTKPPPPKRARQTRVPRPVKSGTKDIFTELHDEDTNPSSDKENDEIDSILMRQDKEKSKRDTRSSMLTEIEQTIAALHMAEQSATPPSVDLHEDKFTITGLTQEDTKVIAKTNPENDWRNSTGSVEKRSSSQLSLSSEIKPELALTAGKDSPKVSPKAKSRVGPKVSPKPSPKVRTKLRCHDDTNTASLTLKESSDNLANASFISSLELKMNGTRSSDTVLQVNAAPHPVCLKKEAPLIDVELPDTTIRAAIAVPENEAITNDDSNLGLTKPESPSGAAHEKLELTEEQRHENKVNRSSLSSSFEITASSGATKTQGNVAVDKAIDEATAKEFRKNVSVKKEEDSHLGNQRLSKSISVEKEVSPLGSQRLSKSISVEREVSPLGSQRLSKSISVEREVSPLGSQRLSKSISVEREVSPLGSQKLNKSISVEKEDSPLGSQKLNKSISVEKEDSPLGSQKLNKSISVEKGDSPLGSQKLKKSITVEKSDSPLGNQMFSKSISVEKEEQIRSERQFLISNGKETENSVNDQVTHNGTDKLATIGTKNESAEEAAQQSSPDRETQSGQNEGTSRGRSQETGKQRRESSEDQTGKGKISKIPVRAGSKPRTSPPKLTSSEKASSPTD